MRTWTIVVSMGILGVACAEAVPADPETAACTELCTELVSACGYDAYPTLDSCLIGCANEVEGNVDIFGKVECILDAECDTFELLACENEFKAE